jgi:hypothetical protein
MTATLNDQQKAFEALRACVDVMLHDGVPTDKDHPARVALDKAEAVLASDAPAVAPLGFRHCQSGNKDVCRAGQRDGVVCPADSCDIDDGERPKDAAASVPKWVFEQIIETLRPALDYIQTHQEQFNARAGDDNAARQELADAKRERDEAVLDAEILRTLIHRTHACDLKFDKAGKVRALHAIFKADSKPGYGMTEGVRRYLDAFMQDAAIKSGSEG